jgi:hypothetical protein
MRFCDAEIGEQQGSGFGLHRAAACDFRFNPATDSDLIPATVPI